jgi:hypothetical protein
MSIFRMCLSLPLKIGYAMEGFCWLMLVAHAAISIKTASGKAAVPHMLVTALMYNLSQTRRQKKRCTIC